MIEYMQISKPLFKQASMARPELGKALRSITEAQRSIHNIRTYITYGKAENSSSEK